MSCVVSLHYNIFVPSALLALFDSDNDYLKGKAQNYWVDILNMFCIQKSLTVQLSLHIHINNIIQHIGILSKRLSHKPLQLC